MWIGSFVCLYCTFLFPNIAVPKSVCGSLTLSLGKNSHCNCCSNCSAVTNLDTLTIFYMHAY